MAQPKSLGRRFIRSVAGIVLLFVAMPLSAQFDSAIEGIVSDSSGAVIPEVEVVLTNQDTGVTREGTTNAAGYYRFPSLPAGKYKVTATKAGFQQ